MTMSNEEIYEKILPPLGQDEDVRLSLLAARDAYRAGNTNYATAILGLVEEVMTAREEVAALQDELDMVRLALNAK